MISAVSVLSAHHLPGVTSPAWQADFSFALKGRGEEAADLHRDQGGKLVPWGGLIEVGRSLLLLVWVVYLFGFVYKKSFFEDMLGTGREGLQRNRGPIVILLLISFVVGGVVTWYHLEKAPNELAGNHSKFWHHYFDEREWWGDWGREFSERQVLRGAEGTDLQLRRELEWKLYRRPYLAYLPYSLINFSIILVPVLGVTYLAGRRAFVRSSRRIQELREELEEAEEPARLVGAVDRLEDAADMLQQTLRRYSAMLLFWLLAASYEVLVGYLTLATLAIFFAVIGFVAVLAGLVFLFPQIWSYVEARLELRRRLRRSAALSKEVPMALERLDGLRLRQLAQDDTLILLQGVGALAGLIATVAGLVENFQDLAGG